MMMSLAQRHLLSIDQLDRAQTQRLLNVSQRMRAIVQTGGGGCQLLAGKVAVVMFYEPSTRTSSSFQAAMLRLGGQTIVIDSHSSSAQKGETLTDTARVLSRLGDVIILRHPVKGSAAEAAAVSRVPVLNAGDGIGEHPSQALLDLFTIEQRRRAFVEQQQESGANTSHNSNTTNAPAAVVAAVLGASAANPLHVTMLGDLKNGRTVHSLSKLLTLYYGAKALVLHLVSPPQLRFPAELLAALRDTGVIVHESDTLWSEGATACTSGAPLTHAHVLYVTRVQKERFADVAQYEAVRHSFKVDRALLDRARPDTCSADALHQRSLFMVMHPLPRVDELATDLDDDPRCCYWDQVENGVYMRMAILARAFGVDA